MESECSAYFTSKRGVPSASEKAWILSSPLRILEKNTRQSSVWSLDEALQMGSLQFIQFVYRVLEANHDWGYRSVIG
jgi:hypothetical protein